MYGEIDKIKLGKTVFPNWRHILSRNKYWSSIYCKKNPIHGTAVGIIVVHFFIEFRYVHLHAYMDIDVASGRMTTTRR